MTALVLAGKLDTGSVNGPQGVPLDWDAILWRTVQEDVRRLRRRIFKASQDGDLKRVRNLQKLMLRSWANTLVSVRQVTQQNAGRGTAGIDGEVALTSPERAALAMRVHHQKTAVPALPVKRVYIPKSNGTQRPLGIPVLADRVGQARVVNALEPEWEARFEPRSYGFRPGRGCHDAIAAIFCTLAGRRAKRGWVLDADLSAAFDRINHQRLLAALGTFPARESVRAWLTAGVVERGQFTTTDEGVPQGGVISPLLLNIALHGMEKAAGVRYARCDTYGSTAMMSSPVLARYADDFVVICHSREQAEQARDRLADWLQPRGLAFNTDKTQIVHVEAGFDFLGFNVRRYSGKLLIKPSPTAIKRMRQRISEEVRALRGANAAMMIRRLNPIIRGWAAYYRTGVSKEVFSAMDHHLWQCLYRWALRSHPNKPKRWVVDRYFGAFNPARKDRWVFGDHDSGLFIRMFSWTVIVRHKMVMGTASVDDPNLTQYWDFRRHRASTLLGGATARQVLRQNGQCPVCDTALLGDISGPQPPNREDQCYRIVRQHLRGKLKPSPAQGTSDQGTYQMVHTCCHQRGGSKARKQRPW